MKEYIIGIETILNISRHIPESRVIIIENNGKRPTFLDGYTGCEIFYTKNNMIETKNKGIKELKDIKDCIEHYHIEENDFIVKLSGRYKIIDSSPFIESLKYLDDVDCILRYGSFYRPSDTRVKDCITGLIGMRCKYVKQIEEPHENDPVEWKWAWVTYGIPEERVLAMTSLGLYMRPMSSDALTL